MKPNKLIKCRILIYTVCDKTFRQKQTLIDHIRTHTGERPFKCDYCNKRFTQLGTKNRHIKQKHSDSL